MDTAIANPERRPTSLWKSDSHLNSTIPEPALLGPLHTAAVRQTHYQPLLGPTYTPLHNAPCLTHCLILQWLLSYPAFGIIISVSPYWKGLLTPSNVPIVPAHAATTSLDPILHHFNWVPTFMPYFSMSIILLSSQPCLHSHVAFSFRCVLTKILHTFPTFHMCTKCSAHLNHLHLTTLGIVSAEKNYDILHYTIFSQTSSCAVTLFNFRWKGMVFSTHQMLIFTAAVMPQMLMSQLAIFSCSMCHQIFDWVKAIGSMCMDLLTSILKIPCPDVYITTWQTYEILMKSHLQISLLAHCPYFTR
jgi:hypothetical protein